MTKNKELQQLIQKYSSYNNRIYDNTSISRDLNIQDQLAFDFIQSYSKQFDVDISDFNFLKYFPSIDDPSFPHTRTELTFGDLILGIKVGELNDQVIAFEENDINLPPRFTVKRILLGIILVLAVSTILSIIALWL